MSKDEKPVSNLEAKDAEKLADSFSETRFAWAFLSLAFIAGLVGLLPMLRDYESDFSLAFNLTLSFIYVLLAFGLSYSFYAICRITVLIEILRKKYESVPVTNFLNERYHVFYTSYLKKNGAFAELRVKFLSAIILIVWIVLLCFKWGAEFRFRVNAMWTNSQILSVIGLIFPLLAVLNQGTKVFYPFKSKEEKKMKYIEKEGAPISNQIAEKEKAWLWNFVLFFVGFLFQVVAKFV